MYNKVIIAGNLTRDIEIRYTQSGSAIGNTGVASTRKFKAADGSQKEEVLFVDLTFFGRTAEIANQYLRKGSKILVDGRLKLDQWEDKQGNKRSKHSITVENLTMLGNKDDNQGAAPAQAAEPQGGHSYANPSYAQPTAAPTPGNAPQPTEKKKEYSAPEQYETTQNQQGALPTIDINEEEIPFTPMNWRLL